MPRGLGIKWLVHRRIGGLEICLGATIAPNLVHRRIGGLEKHHESTQSFHNVHRRIGGLENFRRIIRVILPSSPPHRRLRKYVS